jgi:hypothetical protein
MTTTKPILRALEFFEGSPTVMAKALDNPVGRRVLRQHVEHWVKGERIPDRFVRQVHDMTGGKVPVWESCPTDWWLQWPDLRGQPGAPDVPKEPETAEQGG